MRAKLKSNLFLAVCLVGCGVSASAFTLSGLGDDGRPDTVGNGAYKNSGQFASPSGVVAYNNKLYAIVHGDLVKCNLNFPLRTQKKSSTTKCELMHKLINPSSPSLAIVNGSIYFADWWSYIAESTGLQTRGEMIKCDLNKRDSCESLYRIYDNVRSPYNAQLNMIAVDNSLYVTGLGMRDLRKCSLNKNGSCETLVNFDDVGYLKTMLAVDNALYITSGDSKVFKCDLSEKINVMFFLLLQCVLIIILYKTVFCRLLCIMVY